MLASARICAPLPARSRHLRLRPGARLRSDQRLHLQARENARQVREQISSEMWEQLNRLFLEVKRMGIADVWDVQPLDFCQP